MKTKIKIELTKDQAKKFLIAHESVSQVLGNEHTDDMELIDACETSIPNLLDFTNPIRQQIEKQL